MLSVVVIVFVGVYFAAVVLGPCAFTVCWLSILCVSCCFVAGV